MSKQSNDSWILNDSETINPFSGAGNAPDTGLIDPWTGRSGSDLIDPWANQRRGGGGDVVDPWGGGGDSEVINPFGS